MAKFKPAKSSKAKKETSKTSALRAVPCLILILAGIVLVAVLFYSMMRSSATP